MKKYKKKKREPRQKKEEKTIQEHEISSLSGIVPSLRTKKIKMPIFKPDEMQEELKRDEDNPLELAIEEEKEEEEKQEIQEDFDYEKDQEEINYQNTEPPTLSPYETTTDGAGTYQTDANTSPYEAGNKGTSYEGGVVYNPIVAPKDNTPQLNKKRESDLEKTIIKKHKFYKV